MNNENVKVGFCQYDVIFGNKQKNYDKVYSLLKDKSFDIMVLPELFTSGYFFNDQKEVDAMAETQGGETFKFLKQLASEKNAYIYAGFVEKADGGVYNSSVLVGYDGTEVYYRKAHLFGNEKKFFKKSNQKFVAPDIVLKSGKKITVGLMVCFDWFFPEAARTLALKGAQLLLHTTNLVMPYCPDSMPTRCLENQIFSVTCNRIGTEQFGDKSLTYIGRSVIVNNKAKILAEAPVDKQSVQIIEIENIDDAKNKFINSVNDIFADRRTDLYSLD